LQQQPLIKKITF